MGNHLLWSVLLFFIQPIFLVGLLSAVFNYRKRVRYTRQNFRVNFVRENFEVRDFLLKGLLPGLGLSILSIAIGIPFTLEWFILYQVITILLLIIGGYRLIHPVFTFSLTSILLYLFDLLDIELPFATLNNILPESIYTINAEPLNLNQLISNTLLIAALILFFSTFLLSRKDEYKLFPILRTSKRGKPVAKYQRKAMWLVPLVVVVPGEMFGALTDWWPLLEINGNAYAILILPLLVGFHFTISTQLINDATNRIQKEFQYLAGLGILFFVVSYFVPSLAVIGAVLFLILGLVVLMRHRQRENQWSFRYGPTSEGLRIIAVRADSPAERMQLSVGDIILEMNNYDMMDSDDYNHALAYNRSFVKMRIRRADGEIMMTQTPLYDNDFNNLGLLILDE